MLRNNVAAGPGVSRVRNARIKRRLSFIRHLTPFNAAHKSPRDPIRPD